jgi:acetyl esterase
MRRAAYYIFTTIFLINFCCAANIAADKTLIYKSVGDVSLKLDIFNPPGHKASDKTPAIVFFSGGGWKNWSPDQFFRHSEYLASRGMVAIYAQYRCQGINQTTPKECVKDGKSAIRWVRSNADSLGIDPNRIAGGGGSAGGHIAAATAYVEGFNEEGEDTSVSSRPNALVLFNPVFDNGPDGYGYDRVKDYWQSFSPMHNIDGNAVPTIVFLGTEDQLIPVETAKKYKAITEKAGARCDLHLYEGQKHSFFNHEKFYETLLESDKFLASLGYISGEPTLKREKSEEK